MYQKYVSMIITRKKETDLGIVKILIKLDNSLN